MFSSFLELRAKSQCPIYFLLVYNCRHFFFNCFLSLSLFFNLNSQVFAQFQWLLFLLMFKLFQLWLMGGLKFIFYMTCCCLKASLLRGIIKGPRPTLNFTCSNPKGSAILPRSPGSFRKKRYLKSKILVIGMLIATGLLFFSRPLNQQSQEISIFEKKDQLSLSYYFHL